MDYVGGYSCECPAWKIGNDCSQGKSYRKLTSSEIDHLKVSLSSKEMRSI